MSIYTGNSSDGGEGARDFSEREQDLANAGSEFLNVPDDLPIKDGFITVSTAPTKRGFHGIDSMISELSLGVDDNNSLDDGGEVESDEEEEAAAPKKGMHHRGLATLLPMEEELSFSDESDDEKQEKKEEEKEVDESLLVRGKKVMDVVDQIVNDKYGDSGIYTGNVSEEALVPHGKGKIFVPA